MVGGMFERLIKSTKRWLKKVLNKAILTHEEMLTISAKIQTIIKNRRLTFLYEDPGEQVLTRNYLLFGRKINLTVIGSENGNIQFRNAEVIQASS